MKFMNVVVASSVVVAGCSERSTELGSVASQVSSTADASTDAGAMVASPSGPSSPVYAYDAALPPRGTDALSMGSDTCFLSDLGHVVCAGPRKGTPTATATTGQPLYVVPLEDRAVGLAGSPSATCVRLQSGKVSCFDTAAFPASPLPTVPGLDDAVSVSTQMDRTCAVKAGGQVACWGNGGPFPLGVPTGEQCDAGGVNVDCTTHAEVLPGITDATQVAVGGGYQCVLHATGAVSCWGLGELGNLGDGTTVNRATPGPVPGLSGVVELRASWTTVYALTADGSLYSWGTVDTARAKANAQCTTTSDVSTTPVTVFCATTPALVHAASDTAHIAVSFQDWGGNAAGAPVNRLCELDWHSALKCSGGGSYFLSETSYDVVAVVATSYKATCAMVSGVYGCWGYGAPGSSSGHTGFGAIDLGGF